MTLLRVPKVASDRLCWCSVADLTTAIDAYDDWNDHDHPQPFTWTKTTGELLAEIRPKTRITALTDH